jgi:hypothetical protein
MSKQHPTTDEVQSAMATIAFVEVKQPFMECGSKEFEKFTKAEKIYNAAVSKSAVGMIYTDKFGGEVYLDLDHYYGMVDSGEIDEI